MPISFSGIHFADEAIDILAVSVLLASQLICPLCAFTLRRSVLSVTNSAKIRILVFSLIAGFQIILVSMVYAVADANARIQVHKITQEQSKKDEERRKILAMLTASNIQVMASDVRVISDDGHTAIASVELEVQNVPLIVPYFDFELPTTRDDFGLSFSFHGFPNIQNQSRSFLRAKQSDGKWLFYKGLSDEMVSDDTVKIAFQIEITNLRPSAQQVSTSITPRLTVWRDENNRTVFWNKPIPIKITRF